MLCVTFHAFRFCVIQAYLIDAKHVAHKHTKAVCCGSSTFCTSGPSSDIAYLHTFCVYHVRYTSAVSGVYLQIQQNYLFICIYWAPVYDVIYHLHNLYDIIGFDLWPLQILWLFFIDDMFLKWTRHEDHFHLIFFIDKFKNMNIIQSSSSKISFGWFFLGNKIVPPLGVSV